MWADVMVVLGGRVGGREGGNEGMRTDAEIHRGREGGREGGRKGHAFTTYLETEAGRVDRDVKNALIAGV